MGSGIRRSDDRKNQKIPMLDTTDISLVVPCHYYSQGGYHCVEGHLYRYVHPDHSMDLEGEKAGVIAELVREEGFPIQCPACEGKGVLLTRLGRQTIQFLQTYAYPMLREMVQDIMEEKL